jgi:flagellar basal-body rod modification protein FlgD
MVTAVSPAASSSSSAAFGLDFQSLLQIILTQLTYQDPLKPLDDFQFVSQLAQFSQLEQSQTLNNQVTSLLAAQSASQATGLLGKTVDFTQGSTNSSGTVQTVAFSNGSPTLTVMAADGTVTPNVTLTQITQIQ